MEYPSNGAIISVQQNEALVADFTYEGFTIVVRQMHPDKVSGPDGLSPAFFQYFWTLIGKEVF